MGTSRRRPALLVVTGALLVALPVEPAGADGPVPLVSSPPAACDGPESCVFDVDVPLPDGVVVPGDRERPGNRVRVVLPPGYDTTAGREHPVLLLLHGAGDGSETWTENTDVEELVAERCAADGSRCPVVVMPDGGGKHSETGWYTDWHDGSRQWETFHIGVVMPWARDELAVAGCRGATMVAGLSMGGFGAFSYAGRHPDLFAAAASFSGFLDTRPAPPVSTLAYQLAQDAGLGAPTEQMFGPAGLLTQRDGWAEHNPADLAREGAYRAYDGNLWLATGTGTPGGPAGDDLANAPSYVLEAFVFVLNQTFRLSMLASGSAFHDQSYLGGNHGWPHWQHALRAALPEMLAVTEPCASAAHEPTDEPRDEPTREPADGEPPAGAAEPEAPAGPDPAEPSPAEAAVPPGGITALPATGHAGPVPAALGLLVLGSLLRTALTSAPRR